jgi:hypothetical protein
MKKKPSKDTEAKKLVVEAWPMTFKHETARI